MRSRAWSSAATQRGRELGYPTANLTLGDYQRPKYGIYAVRVTLDDGSEHPGVASLGVRPTFDPPQELLEAHLFDFDGDLYGRTIEVALHAFIREEQKFETSRRSSPRCGTTRPRRGTCWRSTSRHCERSEAIQEDCSREGAKKEEAAKGARDSSRLRLLFFAPSRDRIFWIAAAAAQPRNDGLHECTRPAKAAPKWPTPDTTKTDYRSTVFLPRTDFPMKAGLPQKEPAILARWQSEGLYQRIREARAGREKFIFHDGPPYANGDIHIGHALNHTLKDMVVRTQTLLGKDAPYVPGWDCHGLPIEWKVEEQYRKKKLNKDEVPVREFRAECRAYAQHWVDVQREQLKRLGRQRRLGQALPDDGQARRGDDRLRVVQVRRERPALPRRQAGDVVAGREDRAGRGRDRI